MSAKLFSFQPHRLGLPALSPAQPKQLRNIWAAPRLGICFFILSVLTFASLAFGDIVIQERGATTKTNDKGGLVVPSPTGSGAAAHEDVIELLNGDKLHGTFLSLDLRNGARFQHPSVRQVLSVNPGSIGKISLDRPRATNIYPRQTCGVRLTNNDELVGELVSMDESSLNLSTWYAGELVIPRKMIGSISPGQAQLSAVYAGPTGLDDWTVRGGRNNEAWRFANDSFVSTGSGSIGKDLKIPATSNIEFEINRRGYLQLSVCFYSDTIERYGGNSFMLQFSHNSVYLQRMSRDGNSTSLGQVQVPSLSQKLKARISLRSSKEQKSVAMLVDGVMVKQWSDRGEFPPGTGLVFMQQGQGVVKLSNIRVSEWDGKFEETASAKVKSKEDFVKLANNDKISGTLKVIKDGKLTFTTAFANLDVPMERVIQIDLAEVTSGRADPKPTDVRVTFAQQGSITLALERWDDQQVIGTSPNFGRSKFVPSAFTQLEFNLDKPRPDPDSNDLDEPASGVMLFE